MIASRLKPIQASVEARLKQGPPVVRQLGIPLLDFVGTISSSLVYPADGVIDMGSRTMKHPWVKSRWKPIQSGIETRLEPIQTRLEPIQRTVVDRVGPPLLDTLDTLNTLQKKGSEFVETSVEPRLKPLQKTVEARVSDVGAPLMKTAGTLQAEGPRTMVVSQLNSVQAGIGERLEPLQTGVEDWWKPIQARAEHAIKPTLRKVEAKTGVPLLDTVGTLQAKASGLVGPKKVFLPHSKTFVRYYEKKATSMKELAFSGYHDSQKQLPDVRAFQPPPTLLLLPGIGSTAGEFCALLRGLDVPSHVRVVVPDTLSRPEDSFADGDVLETSPRAVLDTASEFLDTVLRDGTRCHAVGVGLGGGLLYCLRAMRPDRIHKTALVAPAIPSTLSDSLVESLADGSNTFLEFESRDDVERLVRDYLFADSDQRHPARTRAGVDEATRKMYDTIEKIVRGLPDMVMSTKDPFPNGFYEAIYRASLRDVPRGHYKKLQEKLLAEMTSSDEDDDSESIFRATTDVDADCQRLLLWPEEDRISDVKKGQEFFRASVELGTTSFETLPDCGHLFDADRRLIYDVAAPRVKEFLMDFSDR